MNEVTRTTPTTRPLSVPRELLDIADERVAALETALREILAIHDDRFDRHEGYMSGLGLAGRVAQKALDV